MLNDEKESFDGARRLRHTGISIRYINHVYTSKGMMV